MGLCAAELEVFNATYVGAGLPNHSTEHSAAAACDQDVRRDALHAASSQPKMRCTLHTAVSRAPAKMGFKFACRCMIGSAILVANLHGFWLINNPDLSDEALGITR